jgi:hypothetical protein
MELMLEEVRGGGEGGGEGGMRGWEVARCMVHEGRQRVMHAAG